ncbi:MAG: hypothetical protein ABI876_13430 [Bacteroidota bacterium]
MASTNPFGAPSPVAGRSVWERLSPPPPPTPTALNDGERLPRDVRREAEQVVRTYGISVHVYKLKSGRYRGVTGDDPRNLARLDKIAQKITVIHPRKGAAESPLDRIPPDARRKAEQAARRLKRAVVVFVTKTGEFRGVTIDDERSLALYRSRAREIGTVPAPAHETPKTEPVRTPKNEKAQKRTTRTRKSVKETAKQPAASAPPRATKSRTRRAPDKPALPPAPPAPPLPEPAHIAKPISPKKKATTKPRTTTATLPKRTSMITVLPSADDEERDTYSSTATEKAPTVPNTTAANLDKAASRMDKIEALLAQAIVS